MGIILLLIAFNTASVADLYSTQRALEAGWVEGNPILHDRLWLKVPITAGTSWGIWELHKEHPRLAKGITIAATGAYVYFTIRNLRAGFGGAGEK